MGTRALAMGTRALWARNLARSKSLPFSLLLVLLME